MTALLERTMVLPCPPARAFAIFTGKVDLWWPRGHRRTREATMRLDPGPDGRLYELGPDGSEWMLGRITDYVPPERLSFDWFPGSPAAPTAVEITFATALEGTEVRVRHAALSDGAIAAWPDRVAVFARGWDTVLPALSDFIVTHSEEA